MRVFKLLILLSISSVLLIGCGGVDPQEVVGVDNETPFENDVYENDSGVWARDNFNLQAVGNVLEESDNIEDFEKRINTDDRFNNLDLNGDDYVDYISVREFEDKDDNQRGFSLFSRFDGNDIQEIASIIFDRDRPDQKGARVYIDGNDQIYGNKYDYEGNWLDKSLNIARYAFSDRDDNYSSPYYYDNYPDYYTEYRVVETPVYRQRINQYVVNPNLVRIDNPKNFKIKSPYKGKSYNKIYAKLSKPNKEQIVFYRNRENRRKDIREDRRDRRDDRRDDRKDRKEIRKDIKKDIKEDRKERKEEQKEIRKERKEIRKEIRKDRKEDRKDDKKSSKAKFKQNKVKKHKNKSKGKNKDKN